MSIINKSFKIKNIEITNRIVMPPMATSKSDESGEVSQNLCDYYDEKSKGNYIGLIVTEHSYVSLQGKASKGQVSISKNEDIEGLKKLTAVIHNNDTKVIAQINHAGSATTSEVTGCEIVSASSVKNASPASRATEIPRAMNDEDIQKVINDFASAALRAKKAGYDGVEIHSAHGYLLNQFFSPLTNKRTDKYTGSTIDGRIQLHLEVIEAVRRAVGDDFLVALRLGACDYIEGGSTIEDSVYAAKAFEKAGIDLLDISGGFCGYINPNVKEQGYFSEITSAIKKEISISVILTGGITDINAAEKLLAEDKADLIGVGRAILKDSNWAKDSLASL